MKKLSQLQLGQSARIVEIERSQESSFAQQLLEMGFIEGARVSLLHEAPIGRDPIAVSVRGALIALRRTDADTILVEVEAT